MKGNKVTLFLSVLILTLMTAPLALSQTGSLAVWENIANGTLTSTWVEVAGSEWKGQNHSGTWEYNCTVTKDTSYTFNESVNGDRWFDTFEVVADNDETGIGSAMVHNLTCYYALVYYYNSDDHGPNAFPSAHLLFNDTTHFDYWNGTGFESNESNATDLDNDWEKDYSVGDFFRVKALWNFNDDTYCTLRFKLWDPAGDEYPLWMVDLQFPNHPSYSGTDFKSGLFVDSRYDNDPSETDFRRIFFWNISYDLYPLALDGQIACPTIEATDAYNNYAEYADLDFDDIWNRTQLLKDWVNLWDLTTIYTNDLYGPVDNQNDTTYMFTLMLTDTRSFFSGMFGPGIPDDFPDNILGMRAFNTPDGTQNESDYMLIRIDTDNNDVYDSYDYAIWSNDSDLILYQGWTPFVDPWFGDVYSGPVMADEFGEQFRDDEYYLWEVFINWDKVYNGSSGERVGSDLCKMSIGWYDNDSDVLLLLQDFDETSDTTPWFPASDARNVALDPTWEGKNDTSNWIYFYIDESISGDPMADPEDPAGGYTPLAVDDIAGVVYGFICLVFILGLIGFITTSLGRWGRK